MLTMLKSLGPDVEIAAKKNNGEYQTNEAIRLAATVDRNPIDVGFILRS